MTWSFDFIESVFEAKFDIGIDFLYCRTNFGSLKEHANSYQQIA